MKTNYLHLGDCLPFLESLPDNAIDAIITGPPYATSGGLHTGARQRSTNAKYGSGSHRSDYQDFAGDHRDQRSHLRWLVLWLTECCCALKTGSPVCLFTDWRQLPTTTGALQAVGFTWVLRVGVKEGVRPALGRFRVQCEVVKETCL